MPDYCDDGFVTNYVFGIGGESTVKTNTKFYQILNRESGYKDKA